MGAEMIIVVVLIMMVLMIAIEMPVAFAMGLSGALGLVLLRSSGYATNVLGSVPFDQTSSFSLTVIPLFILMGILVVKGDLARQVFAVASYIFRKIPGGLGVATVMACAGFSAVSGSSVAAVATMANLSVDEMRKHGYSDSLAAGIVSVAGTLGVLIPPSIMMIIYALLSGESTGKMLVAGIIPGVLSALFYMIYISISARFQQKSAQTNLAEALAAAGPQSLRGLPWSGFVKILILFGIVIGGMYLGVFTVTESAAVGALAALLMMVGSKLKDGPKKLWDDLKDALAQSASTTTTVFAIVIGSGILSAFFVVSRTPYMLTVWITSLDMSPSMIMAMMLVLMLPLGMFLESISMLVIIVPLFYPIAQSLGFDGIWLGVMIIKLVEIGLITPPVGISCFVVSSTAKVPVERVFKGIIPFLFVDAVILIVLFFYPALATWLPSTMR